MASGGRPSVRAMWSTHISATIIACAGQDVRASEGLKASKGSRYHRLRGTGQVRLVRQAPTPRCYIPPRAAPADPAAAPRRQAGRPAAQAGARSAGPHDCDRPQARRGPVRPPAPRARASARHRHAARQVASARVGLNLARAPAGRRSRGRRCWTPGSCGTRGPPRAGWGSCTCAPRRAPGSARRPAPAPLSPVKCHAPTSRWRSRPPRGGARIAGRQRAALQPDRS